MSAAPTISNDLKAVLRQVKLGRCLDTLPERLAMAKARNLSHAEFLELVLADEVTRRETTSAALRARAAGLDPDVSLDNWDDTTKVTFDHQVWDELCSLRFIDAGHNVMIMGPVGVGKTFRATALGHAAVRRRYTVIAERTDILLKQLRPPGSTTATTPSSASCSASTCSSSTTSPCIPWTRWTPPTSTSSSSNATGPRPPLSRPTGSRSSGWARCRRPPRPVRHRPPPVRRLRTRPRRRELPATAEARTRHRHKHTPTPAPATQLTHPQPAHHQPHQR